LAATGCTHAPPYAVPAGAPQAQIRSELKSMDNYRNGVEISEADTTACKYGRTVSVKAGAQLFSVHQDVSKPAGFIAIEAGRPLHLVMLGWANANRSCTVQFMTEFKPGARYVIGGGIVDEPGQLSGCFVNIVDMDTGERLAKTPAPSLARNCALDNVPLLK